MFLINTHNSGSRHNTMAKGNKKQKTSNGAVINKLSTFDENALTALTDSIEKKFAETKGSPQDATTAEESSKSNFKKEKEHKTKSDKKTSGKKRDASGNIKNSKSAAGNGKIDRKTLLKEVLSMGGTEEDLELIGDADSDDEDLEKESETKPVVDAAFAQELSQFVTGLGIEAPIEDENDAEEENTDEEESEEAVILDDDDEWLDDNEREEISAEDVPQTMSHVDTKRDKEDKKASAKDKKDDKKQVRGLQDPNRLVSRPLRKDLQSTTNKDLGI